MPKKLPKITMETISGLAREAVNHWREHLPQRYKTLKQQGILFLRAQQAADKTNKDHDILVDQGMNWDQAWELVREKYIFLPEEEGASEEPTNESYQLAEETQREFSRIMKEYRENKTR